VNYLLNFNTITESFLRGKAIPMPYSHIRYTLMLAFAFFCCWFLLEKGKFLFGKREKWLQIFLMAFLFLALHVLSVRSSLFALYIGICLLLVRLILLQKHFVWGSVALLLMIAAPYAAYHFIPSLQNKMAYMHYDMSQYDKGEVNNLSDGVRFISMKGGLDVAKQNLWLGVGAGDLKTEMNRFYITVYPQLEEVDRKLPHNQLIWTLATTGIMGLALFLLAFAFPLLSSGNYIHWLLLVFHLILFSSFFTEATLEEQIGTGFYLTFLLVQVNQFRNE
jgi:O-antigen ligase